MILRSTHSGATRRQALKTHKFNRRLRRIHNATLRLHTTEQRSPTKKTQYTKQVDQAAFNETAQTRHTEQSEQENTQRAVTPWNERTHRKKYTKEWELMRGGSHKTKWDRAKGEREKACGGGEVVVEEEEEEEGERKLSSQTCKKTDESDFQF